MGVNWSDFVLCNNENEVMFVIIICGFIDGGGGGRNYEIRIV